MSDHDQERDWNHLPGWARAERMTGVNSRASFESLEIMPAGAFEDYIEHELAGDVEEEMKVQFQRGREDAFKQMVERLKSDPLGAIESLIKMSKDWKPKDTEPGDPELTGRLFGVACVLVQAERERVDEAAAARDRRG